MSSDQIRTNQETLAMLKKASDADRRISEKRNEDGGVIFASKFTPHFRPPKLQLPDRDTAKALDWEQTFSLHAELEPPEVMYYRNRAAFGTQELNRNFTRWLAAEWNIPEEHLFGGQTKDAKGKGDSCFICGLSINNTLLPAIFSSDLFKGKKREVLVSTPIYGLLPQRAHEKKLPLIAIQAKKENGYKPDADSIAEALEKHPNARALLLVNPGNPAGTYLSREEISRIAEVVDKHNQGKPRHEQLIVIVDETFRHMLWPRMSREDCQPTDIIQRFNGRGARYPEFPSMGADARLHNHIITLGSFSKELAPGLGFAYATGHPDFIRAIHKQTQESLPVETLNKAAAYFSGDPEVTEKLSRHRNDNTRVYMSEFFLMLGGISRINQEMKKRFGADRDYVEMALDTDAGFHLRLSFKGLQGMRLPDPEPGKPKVLKTSADLAVALRDRADVTAYPGEMFHFNGDDMILRFSLNMDTRIVEMLQRVEDFCLSLEKPRTRSAHLPPEGPSAGMSYPR